MRTKKDYREDYWAVLGMLMVYDSFWPGYWESSRAYGIISEFYHQDVPTRAQ